MVHKFLAVITADGDFVVANLYQLIIKRVDGIKIYCIRAVNPNQSWKLEPLEEVGQRKS